jgi:hypothetical protein
MKKHSVHVPMDGVELTAPRRVPGINMVQFVVGKVFVE